MTDCNIPAWLGYTLANIKTPSWSCMLLMPQVTSAGIY
jgi:hypothetical protein